MENRQSTGCVGFIRMEINAIIKEMKEHQLIKEKSNGWKGKITFTNFFIDSDEAKAIDSFLKTAQNISEDLFLEKIKRLKAICFFNETVKYNNIVMSGRSVFARRLANDTTYTGIINYGALGSSSTAVSDSQTQLVAEVKRKPVAARSRTNDSVTVRFYYSKSDTSGTYEEFGTFIDGTVIANSGQMFNRALTGGWTKSSSESLTVTVQLDLNPA